MSEQKESETGKINLDEIVGSMSDECRKEMTWSIGDHKFLCGIFDAHTKVIAAEVDLRLKSFADGTWKELIDFIKNQYEGISNQLSRQTELINDVKGKVYDLERSIGMLKTDFCKLQKEEKTSKRKISNHEKRIKSLEEKVKDIDEKIHL
jgi:septal ring factor EnvC (AmiA/AmiB activator)